MRIFSAEWITSLLFKTRRKWQKKTGSGATLTFANLTIGQTYRLSAVMVYSYSNTADGSINWSNNGATIIDLQWGMNSGGNEEDGSTTLGGSSIFVAAATTIVVSISGNFSGQAVLEEYNGEQTTQWT